LADQLAIFGRSEGMKGVLVFRFGEPHECDDRPLAVGREAVAEHEVVPHDTGPRQLELLARVRRGERQLEPRSRPDPVRDQRRARLLRFGLVVGCRAEMAEGDDTRTSEQ